LKWLGAHEKIAESVSGSGRNEASKRLGAQVKSLKRQMLQKEQSLPNTRGSGKIAEA
jgi:hypothetical protein